jgi:hypothetical protein
MGTVELWMIGVCPPTGEHQCQAKPNGSPRCRRKAKTFVKHKPSRLMIEVCEGHSKALVDGAFGWRHMCPECGGLHPASQCDNNG